MYHNNINLSLTFLGFFLITNVFGATGVSGLAKNRTIALGYNVPSDDPKFGELENLLC